MRAFRTRRRLSLIAVAAAVGVHFSMLSRVERSQRRASIDLADKLAAFYRRRGVLIDPVRLARERPIQPSPAA